MTEVQALFLILAAIYLLQCIVWLPRDCVAFRRGLRGRWKRVRSGVSLEALKLRGVLVNPLPPLPGLIACDPIAIFLSPLGIAAATPSTETPREELSFASFDEISSIQTHEKNLMINDAPFVALRSPAAAREAATLLAKIRKSAVAERARRISNELHTKFDSKVIVERLSLCKQATSPLRFSCNLLFVLLFVLAPLMVWQRSLATSWLPLLAVLLIYLMAITWSFARAHKALYPNARDERFSDTLTVALSPAGALRANDLLLRDLLRDFHPVAVAHALCSPAEFEAFASQILRDLTFPRLGDAGSSGEQVRLWWQNAELAAVKSFLLKIGTDPALLLQPPTREPECNSYCPRCLSQYMLQEGTCAECGDLELRPFPESPVTEPVVAK